MKAVVAAFNQEKALVGAFSVITNLRICFGCNFLRRYPQAGLQLEDWPGLDTSGHCYAGLTPASAEHEDRVREALGLAGEVSGNPDCKT